MPIGMVRDKSDYSGLRVKVEMANAEHSCKKSNEKEDNN